MTSNTQRTMTQLRKKGWVCAVVEKWNHHVKIRQDLWGWMDVIAYKDDITVGIQVCSMTGRKEHLNKILANKYTKSWSASENRLIQLWSWRKLKVKRGGKAFKWEAKIEEVFVAF